MADLLVTMILLNQPKVAGEATGSAMVQAVPVPAPGVESMVEIEKVVEVGKVDESRTQKIDDYAAVNNEVIRQAVANRPAPAEVQVLIDRYAGEYNVDSQKMKTIASCESGFNQGALSPNGLYGGLYQFVASTWVSNRLAMGLDPNPDLRFNGEEAIKTAAFKMARDGFGAWPVCGMI